MRTPDTLIKSQVLYQLSYRGITYVLNNTLEYNSIFAKLCQYLNTKKVKKFRRSLTEEKMFFSKKYKKSEKNA